MPTNDEVPVRPTENDKDHMMAGLKGLESELIDIKQFMLQIQNDVKQIKQHITLDAPTITQHMLQIQDDVKQIKHHITQATPTITQQSVVSVATQTPPTPTAPKTQSSDEINNTLANLSQKIKTLEDKLAPKTEPLKKSFVSVAKKDVEMQGKSRVERQRSIQNRDSTPNSPPKHAWFSGPSDPLSNLYMGWIYVFGRWYKSAEHAYQMTKAAYHKNSEALQRLRNAKNSRDAQDIGKNIHTGEAWHARKGEIMRDIITAKAEHCAEYRDRLKQTDGQTLMEDTHHSYWGGRRGENLLGQIHMQVRDLLKTHKITPAEAIPSQDSTKTAKQDRITIATKPAQATPTVTILGDSNIRHMDPQKMTKFFHIRKHEAKTTAAAMQALNTTPPSDIYVIHTGTNDLYEHGALATAQKIGAIADEILSNNKKVVISKLLPKEGRHQNHMATETNIMLENRYRQNSHVVLTNTDSYYYGEGPNEELYTREHNKYGKQLPLLHLNHYGVAKLSRQIQWALGKVSRAT